MSVFGFRFRFQAQGLFVGPEAVGKPIWEIPGKASGGFWEAPGSLLKAAGIAGRSS